MNIETYDAMLHHFIFKNPHDFALILECDDHDFGIRLIAIASGKHYDQVVRDLKAKADECFPAEG